LALAEVLQIPLYQSIWSKQSYTINLDLNHFEKADFVNGAKTRSKGKVATDTTSLTF